ncbi:hypothetical protein J3A83DRAFT_4242751 [Scleroderma citrinum]
MDGSDTAIIEVQSWMNHVSFDSIGNAGFSHDLSSLDGTPASMTKIFSFLLNNNARCLRDIARPNQERKRRGRLMEEEKSVIGLLRCTVKANGAYSMLRLTIEEVVAQVAHRLLTMLCIDSLLQFANKWKHCLLPAMKRLWLHGELLSFSVGPTYDQLNDSRSYLDPIVRVPASSSIRSRDHS